MLGGIGQIIAAFGSQSLEVFEWSQSDVRKKRLPNNPTWSQFAKSRPDLQFTGWQLAHAVVKADFLVERNLLLPGIGLLLQVNHIIEFRPGANLRLVAGGSNIINDFTRSSLSGRLAQGLSLLFAHKKGYYFVGHLASDQSVLNHVAASKKTLRIADFLFEDVASQRMILESKGSFSSNNNDPSNIKSILKDALKGQVDYWMSNIVPSPVKGFVVYSCLREIGGPAPSALIFVDPPEQRGDNPLELPRVWVRRRNYAAWLHVMGFAITANNLRQGEIYIPTEVYLPIIQIAGRRYAVSSLFPQPTYGRWLCAGLDVEVLTAIEEAMSGNEESLLNIDVSASDDIAIDNNLSIFNDGSIFGIFDAKSDFVTYKSFKI